MLPINLYLYFLVFYRCLFHALIDFLSCEILLHLMGLFFTFLNLSSARRSLCASKIRELGVGSWRWLMLCSIQIPGLVLIILFICAEFGGACKRANRAKVLIQGVLHLVCRCGGRLLLRWFETICRFWEWTRDCGLHYWAIKAFTCQIVGIIVARSGPSLLPVQLHVKVAEFFAHGVRCAASLHTESVFFLVALWSRQILIFLLQNFVNVQFFHGWAWHTEGIRWSSHFSANIVNVFRTFDTSEASLMLFYFLVAESVLTYAKACRYGLCVAQVAWNLVAESICPLLFSWETVGLRESKLLLGSRVVDHWFLSHMVRHGCFSIFACVL